MPVIAAALPLVGEAAAAIGGRAALGAAAKFGARALAMHGAEKAMSHHGGGEQQQGGGSPLVPGGLSANAAQQFSSVIQPVQFAPRL